MKNPRWPYTTLLALLLFVSVARPWLPEGGGLRNWSVALTLLACVWVTVNRGQNHRLAIALVLTPVVLQWAPVREEWRLLSVAAFFLYTAVVILKDVLSSSRVNVDKLFGSVCAYFLIGLVFAQLYFLIELRNPGSFRVGASNDVFDDMVYYSLVTMTTMGYGDIVPVARGARSLAAVQAVFGQFYMAILVGRLLALHLEQRKES